MKFKGKAEAAYEIAEKLKDSGHIAYFAGGCVRDEVMGKIPKDYDIATSAPPDFIEKLFPKTVPVGKQFGVIIVIHKGISFEVATFRREAGYEDGRHPSCVTFTDAEEDARRRDFTVNGLFYDPFEERILDYVDGLKDVSSRVIRAIGGPSERFREDKLRILRAIRFAANLDFEIDPETYEAVKKNASWIQVTSAERIRDELVKIFTRPGADRGLELLSQTGLLRILLPEVEAMKGVEQPEQFHPEGDAFVHTKLLLKELKSPSAVLAFSSLLHDVGKPLTGQIRKGRRTFYEHPEVGAKIAEDVMRRLRFSNEEIHAVTACVSNHMKFADVQKMRVGKLKRLLSRPTFNDELELHRVDCLASHGNLDNYYFLQRKVKEFSKEDLKPKPLLSGDDLISLGMKPGPVMKPILEEAFEMQLEGKISNKEQAIQWAKRKGVGGGG